MNQNSEASFLTYYRLLNILPTRNFFLLPWAKIVLRNFARGRLVKYKSLREFKQKKVPIWVLCELVIFKDTTDQSIFPAYHCKSCQMMDGLENLRFMQDRRNIESMKCWHSRMCHKLTEDRDWRTIWPVQIPQGNIEYCKISVNEDIRYTTLLGKASIEQAVKVYQSLLRLRFIIWSTRYVLRQESTYTNSPLLTLMSVTNIEVCD